MKEVENIENEAVNLQEKQKMKIEQEKVEVLTLNIQSVQLR